LWAPGTQGGAEGIRTSDLRSAGIARWRALPAWAHGTVGSADVCAPSWAGRSERDITYLNPWLDQGYAVVASDYQGLGTPGGHPCLTTRPEAYSVLDSVRAVEGGELALGSGGAKFDAYSQPALGVGPATPCAAASARPPARDPPNPLEYPY
jgi:Secretory lipase